MLKAKTSGVARRVCDMMSCYPNQASQTRFHVCSVFVRARRSPSAGTADWKFSDNSLSSARANSTKEYQLDGVFHQHSTRQVYDRSTKPLIQAVLDGFSCTIFAYGQTASGKTHTMRGTKAEPGIVVHAVQDLFASMLQSESKHQREFCIRASYLEVCFCYCCAVVPGHFTLKNNKTMNKRFLSCPLSG